MTGKVKILKIFFDVRTQMLGKIMNNLKFGLLLFILYLLGCIEKPQSQLEALASPSPELLDRIEPLIQPSIDFTYRNEKYAIENGVELTVEEKALAIKIGVENVDKVRVVYVDEFPFPKNQHLVKLARAHGFNSPRLAGMTYGFGVYIRNGKEFILPHELVHVRQFEEKGVENFMKRYMLELAVMGYRSAPLEVKAYNEAKRYKSSSQ